MTLPSPEEQVQFLRNLQRLLAEGQFVASYKFALIHALADLAVLQGDDSGAELTIGTKAIAAKFIERYWRQARTFPGGDPASGWVLQQNSGQQAAIISQIARARAEFRGSFSGFRHAAQGGWNALVAKVEKVVCSMPLWKLQTLGSERLEFLYENVGQGASIVLKPGAAYCLRAFYELIRDLIEGAWIRFIQKMNAKRFGNLVDLGTFLFAQERSTLDAYRPILFHIQKGACQYCAKPLAGTTQVDHFVPWSRYACDLGENMVLAHDRCNRAKSDLLAAEPHLAAWIKRNDGRRLEFEQRLAAAALPCDRISSDRIAKWAYHKTEKAKGQVWVDRNQIRHLGPDWARCFAA